MKKLYCILLGAFGFLSMQAQHEYMPLSYDYSVLYAGKIYKKDINLHSSVRPLRSSEVYAITDVDSNLQALRYKGKFWNTLIGRSLFSDHLIQVRTEDFDLSIDPLVDFRYGMEQGSNNDFQYHNTRGFYIQGRIGKQVTFMTSLSENQARFPDYVNSFVSASGVVPGQGPAKTFNTTGWDFRNAFGVVSYTPSKYFNFSLGQGRVFFGEGHRSTFLSDGTFNYPYFKIETSVWKIKYVNLWTQMQDTRKSVEVNQANRKKWVSAHYLSFNVNSRLNLSLFEAVIYGSDTNNRGLEASYFNPVILYRPIESANGSDAGNVLLGFGASYKLTDGLMAYGQFTLDELNIGEFFGEKGSWRNKYGWQLGMKYLNAFAIENLHLRLEYNLTRPYMYQHIRPLTNYGHYNQPLAHPWGANFNELVMQAHYRYRRITVDLQLNYGKTGLDTSGSNWGKDIYQPYGTREQDDNNEVAQGVTTTVMYVEGRIGYLVNPSYNLRVEAGAVLRSQIYESSAFSGQDYSRPYIYLGLRTALFNNYFDF